MMTVLGVLVAVVCAAASVFVWTAATRWVLLQCVPPDSWSTPWWGTPAWMAYGICVLTPGGLASIGASVWIGSLVAGYA